MRQERTEIKAGESHIFELGGIIVSVLNKALASQKSTELVVGKPGMPNFQVTLGIGGAALYETPLGMFEVRLLSSTFWLAKIILTEIAPRPGLSAGYIDQDVENAPFTGDERQRLAKCLEDARREIAEHAELNAQQLDLVTRKLIEMSAAADRFGRKDWINWALGTLTSLAITAGLEHAAAKVIFQAVGTALSWIVGSTIKLLE